jgi:acyl dehydratase
VALGEPRALAEFVIAQHAIDVWADLADDHNPLHVDHEYAAGTRFGTTIAHGHLVMAHLLEAMAVVTGADWSRGGQLRDVRFKGPLKAGARCQLSSPPPVELERGTMLWKLELRDTATGELCVTGEAVLSTAPSD